MTIEPFDEWARYALIAQLAEELGRSQSFGKKAVQKIVYLLQELGSVPAGFRYTFYTYGVFSSELANTLGVVEGLEGIKIDYDASQNSYQIHAGEKVNSLKERGQQYLDKHKKTLEKVVNFAKKSKTALKLELISTIVFIKKNEGIDIETEEETLVQRVKDLKPRFNDQEIRQGINDLRSFFSELEAA